MIPNIYTFPKSCVTNRKKIKLSTLASSMVLCHLNNIELLESEKIKIVLNRNSEIFTDP